MGIYRLAADPGKTWFSWIWKACLLLVVLIGLIFASAHFESSWRTRFPSSPDVPVAVAFLCSATAILVVALFLVIPKVLRKRADFQVEVAQDGVSLRTPYKRDVFLPREEILGWKDSRNGGMVLLTANPWRSIGVFPDLENYSAFQAELRSLGIAPIDSQTKWQIVHRVLLPVVLLLGSAAAVWKFRSPQQVLASGLVMLACMYWLASKTHKYIYKNGTTVDAIFSVVLLGFVLLHRLLSLLHQPTIARRAVQDFELIFVLILLGWQLYRRRAKSS